ncbi:MAG TPA: terminase large subunit [Phycisphaerae bacterium]|nr:terminase large subunit [Phycisphaerae bacterium]
MHCAVVDELHAHKTRRVYDVLETATGSRSQPLLLSITTAGSDRAGVCYEQRSYVTKLLDRTASDETYFGIVYTLDDADDWTDEAVWGKANPNLDVSVYRDDMRRLSAKAQTMASAANAFITKRLDRWVNASSAWLDMRAWERCADSSLELDGFAGQPCFIGVDLASSLDIAAVSLLFPGDDGAYTLFGRYYLPEERVESGGNSQYVGWAATGKLIATPGAANDLRLVGRIGQDLLDSMERFRVPMAAFDPWRAVQLRQDLDALGHTVVEVPPGFRHFTEPMKELEALVVSGKLRHDGSPVLTWMMANTIARIDGKDNIQPGKEFPENKIDGVVSAIMALGMALRNEDQPSPYKDRGVVFV